MATLAIFTTTTCPNCHDLKRRFEAAKIPYVERNLEETEWRLRGYQFGGFTAPFVVLNNERLIEGEELCRI